MIFFHRLLLPAVALLCSLSSTSADVVILIQGAAGDAEKYGPPFATQVSDWQSAAQKAGHEVKTVLPSAEDQLKRAEAALRETPADAPAWLVLIGHGTDDRRSAKFNLAGPDLEAAALAKMLAGRKAETIIIAAFSASGAFLKPLAQPGRVLVCATQTGAEASYSRFGSAFSEAISGRVSADLDQDGAVSVLEAFLHAAHGVQQFYESEGRISTEHAVLDDNGDGLATRSEKYQGVRVQAPHLDGVRAHQLHLIPSAADQHLSPAQRSQRDALEQEVRRVIESRATLGEAAYYQQLEQLFLQIAQLTASR